MENKPKLIAVLGPTASGKTSLAVELAQKYHGEVISADSMQIYKGMSIATAKPDLTEMKGVPHHLMDFLDPEEVFSVSDYVRLANSAAHDIISRGHLPILCGGTGLYVRSFLENVQFSDEQKDPVLRATLNERYHTEGGEKLIEELRSFDPETAEKLLPSNSKRIIRAIEIYRLTGITMSESIRRSKQKPPVYDVIAVGITYADRQKLYDRINKRVDCMMKAGLLEEAKLFYASKIGTTAAAAIGYKELKPYLDGEKTLEEAIEHLKQETRHYAKRQLTWFRRDAYINWIEADRVDSVYEEAIKIIERDGLRK